MWHIKTTHYERAVECSFELLHHYALSELSSGQLAKKINCEAHCNKKLSLGFFFSFAFAMILYNGEKIMIVCHYCLDIKYPSSINVM